MGSVDVRLRKDFKDTFYQNPGEIHQSYAAETGPAGKVWVGSERRRIGTTRHAPIGPDRYTSGPDSGDDVGLCY